MNAIDTEQTTIKRLTAAEAIKLSKIKEMPETAPILNTSVSNPMAAGTVGTSTEEKETYAVDVPGTGNTGTVTIEENTLQNYTPYRTGQLSSNGTYTMQDKINTGISATPKKEVQPQPMPGIANPAAEVLSWKKYIAPVIVAAIIIFFFIRK